MKEVKNMLPLINTVLIGFILVFMLVGGNDPLGGTRFPSGISADSTSPSAGQVRGTTLTSTGAATLSGAVTVGTTLDVTGETRVQGFTQGGGILNIATTGAAITLTEAQMLTSNVIEITADGDAVALALTLPATSTMTTLLSTAGDFREWTIDNQHLAATTTTVTAGTGIDLIGVTTDDDVIDGQEVSRLTCWRKENTDVYCITSELLKVD